MLGITDLTTYLLGTMGIVLLPGPNSMYVLTVAAQRGTRSGYQGAWGIVVGDTILMLISILGMASVMRNFPMVFQVIKYLGAAYLSYIAVRLLISAYQGYFKEEKSQSKPSTGVMSLDRPFRNALVISLMNPKAILFFVSFFIQFVDPNYVYPALSFLVLGVLLQIISVSYLSGVIFFGQKLSGVVASKPIAKSLLMTVIALMFIGFALKLALSVLNP
jgi:leucine efflux protein